MSMLRCQYCRSRVSKQAIILNNTESVPTTANIVENKSHMKLQKELISYI